MGRGRSSRVEGRPAKTASPNRLLARLKVVEDGAAGLGADCQAPTRDFLRNMLTKFQSSNTCSQGTNFEKMSHSKGLKISGMGQCSIDRLRR